MHRNWLDNREMIWRYKKNTWGCRQAARSQAHALHQHNESDYRQSREIGSGSDRDLYPATVAALNLA
jgi:hypothetical protein